MPKRSPTVKKEAFEMPWKLYASISLIPVLILCVSLAFRYRNSSLDLASNGKSHILDSKQNYLIHTAKLELPVTLHFSMVTEIPKANEPMEYVARFSRESSQRHFQYSLNMPTTVQLISGAPYGHIDLTDADVEVRFSVIQTDDTDQKINLLLSDAIGSVSNVYTLSTLDFHKNEDKQKELIARRDEYHQEIGKSYRAKK